MRFLRSVAGHRSIDKTKKDAEILGKKQIYLTQEKK
jgi:hypothetical protein